MDMESPQRRAKPPQAAGSGGDQMALWGTCALLSSLSLLVAAASLGLGATRLTLTTAGSLVWATGGVHGAAGDNGGSRLRYCSEDDDLIGSMSADGEWVRRERGAAERVYGPGQCPFVDEGFRCRENGRADGEYAEWRWRPRRCTLPRFDAARLLGILRNRRLVFVGDSIGRNQWESMLCMLATAVADADQGSSIYEENGSPITKHRGFLSFRFRDFNCTVEHYRSPYLVRLGRPSRRSPEHVATTLQLGAMDPSAPRWKDADVLVFNTGHWWSTEKLQQLGCYFQDGNGTLRLNMSVENAYQSALNTLQNWIRNQVNATKTLAVLRTYSAAHVSDSNGGSGGCARETAPELNTSRIALHRWPGLLNPSPAFIEAASSSSSVKELHLLNVTLMTAQRRDGHPSVYNVLPSLRAMASPPAGVGVQQVVREDCSHWCLPGVPDVWNELLYSLILHHQEDRIGASS